MLAAKCALAIRVDALGDSVDATLGLEAREKVEARLRQLEGRTQAGESGRPRGKADTPKYDKSRQGAAPALASTPKAYNADADVAEEGKKVRDEGERGRVCVCSVVCFVCTRKCALMCVLASV